MRSTRVSPCQTRPHASHAAGGSGSPSRRYCTCGHDRHARHPSWTTTRILATRPQLLAQREATDPRHPDVARDHVRALDRGIDQAPTGWRRDHAS